MVWVIAGEPNVQENHTRVNRQLHLHTHPCFVAPRLSLHTLEMPNVQPFYSFKASSIIRAITCSQSEETTCAMAGLVLRWP